MTSSRARWLAARTRNAARHGLVIAGTGALVMIAALLTFVLLPRQADRALSTAIAALPPARDTVQLRAQRVRADAARARAEGQRTAARKARADSLPGSSGTADSLFTTAMLPVLARDTALRAFAAQLARARQTPLMESYRALSESPVMQRDSVRRAAASRLRDSLDVLYDEREALAALRGPDARYAALTMRLTEVGDQLVALADRTLRAQAQLPEPASTVPVDAARPDSLLDAAVRLATDSVVALDTLLAAAQRFNAILDAQRAALRARMQLSVPPVAMLLASLVLGLSGGFSVAVWREMRLPMVGDAQELEALTRSRVIVHQGDAAAPGESGGAWRMGARRLPRFARRARPPEAPVPVLTPAGDAWPLLHLTLSHVGDVSREVQVLADHPVVAGAVGLNLASVAARESRATALVDAAQRAGALVPLLPTSALVRSDGERSTHGGGATGAFGADTAWEEAWDASRALPLGRDASVTLVLPRRARADAGARARAGGPEHPATADTPTRLEPLLRHFDFTVYVSDLSRAPAVPAHCDLVLCARLGETPLAWVARTVRAAEEQGRRIRAVVLWATDVPLAGSRASG
ncbi:MAG: hypothetical protein ACK55A_01405 [Gemmatimonas sp.]